MPVTLQATEYGEGEPIAILHGLFGSGRNWASIAQRLAAGWRVVAFDMRNHGASPWTDRMDYRAMADDIRLAMQQRGYRRYALLGHSMGGKAAMVAALTAPQAIEKLVVVDIAPVVYPIMPYAAYVAAMRALDLSTITRRREADAKLAEVVKDAAERAFLLQNLVLGRDVGGGDGPPRWRINLPAIEAALGTLAGFPALPGDARYDGPALFVAGGRSRSLPAAHEPAVNALFGNAAFVRIAEAGHWVHADAPDAFVSAVEPFLAAGIFSDAD
ncbi:MAG TPA: alpha/beta fold hydrolase [Stellaceae bacterium]|nr:alpha/beta fold hydrolase [Stellaceae bacterium]